MTPQTFGEKIRLMRHEKGWNQTVLAQKLNISTATYSKMESADIDVNLTRMNDIATIYSITLLDLLWEEKEPEKVELTPAVLPEKKKVLYGVEVGRLDMQGTFECWGNDKGSIVAVVIGNNSMPRVVSLGCLKFI